MPKIKIVFAHSKKNNLKYTSLSTFFFDADSSTGPVIERGKSTWLELDARDGDVVEFSTTKFADEFDVKLFRNGKLLNGANETAVAALRREIAKAKAKRRRGK